MNDKKQPKMNEELVKDEELFLPKDVLDALAHIAEKAHDSHLSESFGMAMLPCFDLLRKKYALNPFQCVVIAMIIDAGKPLNNSMMAHYLDIRNAEMMRHEGDIEELVKKRILHQCKDRTQACIYHVRADVRTAFCMDEPLGEKEPKEVCLRNFTEDLDTIFSEHNDHLIDCKEMDDRLDEILGYYQSLPLVWKVKKYQLNREYNKLLLYTLHKCMVENSDLVSFYEIKEIFDNRVWVNLLRSTLMSGENELAEKDVMEFYSQNGMADTENLCLTFSAKKIFCEELGFDVNNKMNINGLIQAESIQEKPLFYNERESEEVERLTELLSEEHFAAVQKRLEEVGMRKGFACLFHGGPGTGKTETVLQIARKTGRDIMQVDLSTVRDKFVGETEKNVKALFDEYRRITKCSGKTPILLFNEADAIICKRSTNTQRSVDKMENAMQNIILQEMEQLEGILIATTNLTDNMDNAFARRFLYKIQFDRPSTQAKAAIWRSVMPRLGDYDAMSLASAYDLSGGQIENIIRKQTIDYILSGQYASIEQMHDYCRKELSSDYTQRNAIGFM